MKKPVPTVDGFFWTRVTAKLLRFLYEPIALEPLPPPLRERVEPTGPGENSKQRAAPPQGGA